MPLNRLHSPSYCLSVSAFADGLPPVLIVTPFGLPLPASKARLVGFSGVPHLLRPASCVLMSPADDRSCEMLVASQTVTMADEIFSPVLR